MKAFHVLEMIQGGEAGRRCMTGLGLYQAVGIEMMFKTKGDFPAGD